MSKLYIVATPIGNLGDITGRSAEILAAVDFIAAEDTRVSVKLLNHLKIKKPLVSYYEHNSRRSGEMILSRILGGESCALVSDAGMPAISDPGAELVAMCAENGVEIIVIPGPCALVAAVALSGFSSGRFTFEGFLSMNRRNRMKHIKGLINEARDMVFYEAPHKLEATLADLYAVLGNRRISISRELTKLHEETLRFSLCEAIEYFKETRPRGEFVFVVEGKKEQTESSPEDALEYALELIREGMTLKDAVREAAVQTGVSKNTVYAMVLAVTEEDM